MKRKLTTILAILLVMIMAGCAALAKESDQKHETPQQTTSVLEETTQPTETKAAETKPAQTQPAETKPTQTTQTKKTLAQAKKIALDHAGVKQADARDLEAELDWENGKEIYEVSFEAGGYDYDYEIDAYSGKILRSEKERDD